MRRPPVLGGLGSPGVDRTYQLWMVNGGRATDEGTLGTGAAGGTVLVEGVRDEQAFAITNEPAGGSPTPTRHNW
jgi:anti-sigma-K factor RskA